MAGGLDQRDLGVCDDGAGRRDDVALPVRLVLVPVRACRTPPHSFGKDSTATGSVRESGLGLLRPRSCSSMRPTGPSTMHLPSLRPFPSPRPSPAVRRCGVLLHVMDGSVCNGAGGRCGAGELLPQDTHTRAVGLGRGACVQQGCDAATHACIDGVQRRRGRLAGTTCGT